MRHLFINSLFVICVLAVAYFGAILKDSPGYQTSQVLHKEEAFAQNNVRSALLALGQQDLNLPNEGYELEVLPIHYTLSNWQIHQTMMQQNGVSQSVAYAINDIGTYTMSSPAINGSHYLVNTYLEGYAPFPVDNVMVPLYILSQRKQYQLDANQYAGREEVWQSSRQAFYYPRGDCEDHAIVLADWLIENGEDARVVVGDVARGGGHAWVVLFKHGKQYLLEATQKSGLSATKPYPLAVLYTDYHPQFMFNREYFWENAGSKYTTQYAGKQWHRNSHYKITDKQAKQFKYKPLKH